MSGLTSKLWVSLSLMIAVSFTPVVVAEVETTVTHTGTRTAPHTAAHKASPDAYEVLLENEEVLVLKMVLAPKQADQFHHHHNETVYFQSGGKLRIASESGQPVEVDIPDGHVMWHEAWGHQVTNIGNTDVVAIIVEAKPYATHQ